MFAAATKNLLQDVDRGGFLVPVPGPNDRIVLLSLVIKRRCVWFWQKPKYLPTDFSFNDVLAGDTPISPVVTETDFLKYSGMFSDTAKGKAEANFANANVVLKGRDASRLQSSFGCLKREELDLQKLLRDSKGRVLDMSHDLIQQTKEKQREVFGLVKVRIVTTQPCSVVEEVQQMGHLGGLLSVCGPKSTKVSLKENGSLTTDSNVTLEIPPHTPIAYGLTELEVKADGRFELCLMSNTDGGFEVDGPASKHLVGASPQPTPDPCLKQELEKLDAHFQRLSALQASTRCSLLRSLSAAMEDQEAVGLLENVLSQRCLGESPALEDVQVEAHRRSIQALLDLVEPHGGEGKMEDSALFALYLIVSALDELTDSCLAVLSSCCSPSVLQALDLLAQCVAEGGGLSLKGAGLAPLTGEIYEKTERLFSGSRVLLKRVGDTVEAEFQQQPGHRPLVLCIAIRGLAALANTL